MVDIIIPVRVEVFFTDDEEHARTVATNIVTGMVVRENNAAAANMNCRAHLTVRPNRRPKGRKPK